MIPSVNIVPIRDINGPAARQYASRDTVYVSPSGKDGYLGASPNLPLRSVKGIKRELSKLKSGDSKKINVDHLDGEYRADQFFFDGDEYLYFKHDEAGDDVYSVDFRAVNKGKVVIDNSITYYGFEEIGDLWRIKINYEDIRKCNMFGFVNDVRTVPARWPKYGCLSEFNTVTYGGITYMKCVDSTGFLQSIFEYVRDGGDKNHIGVTGTIDFMGFLKNSTLPAISATIPNIAYNPSFFYIPQLGTHKGIQVYANQFTIKIPTLNKNGVSESFWFSSQDITQQMMSASPTFVNLYYNSVEEFVTFLEENPEEKNVIYYKAYDEDLAKVSSLYPQMRIDTSHYNYFFEGTSLENLFEYKNVVIPAGINYWYYDNKGLFAPHIYEPSNLNPTIVCSELGENTIIKENGEYYFYYNPTPENISQGIDNCRLQTYNIGNVDGWTSNGNPRHGTKSYGYCVKSTEGYVYYDINKQDTYSTGFTITKPTNVSFTDLNFKYCQAPITLNNAVSGWSVSDGSTVNNLISQYSSSIAISGCEIYNTFGSAVMIRNTSNAKILKNLIYSCEGSGIQYHGGHDIIINNNIVKSCQQVDTRLNTDFCDVGTIDIEGQYTGSHAIGVITLTGVDMSHNECGYSGNGIVTAVTQDLSSHHNKIYNAGFGANSDMVTFHNSFSYPKAGRYSYNYNNLIYNARASSNNNFLGNLIYYDGRTSNQKTYNNILANGQTGIQFTCNTNCSVENNIFYGNKVTAITHKSNNGDMPVSVNFNRNIFVAGSAFNNTPSPAFIGWNGQSPPMRSVSTNPYYADIKSNTGTTTGTSRPLFAWNSKIRYAAVAGGGVGTVTDPQILFNGNNWIIGDRTGNTASPDFLTYRISSFDTSGYQYPWEVPDDRWIKLNNSTSTVYTTFSAVRRSGTRRSNTTGPTLTSNNNLFWSTLPQSTTILNQNNSNFFRYNGSIPFSGINGYANIPDPGRYNDNSVPSVFGEIALIETQSLIQDPLFIDPINKDFRLVPNSPALDVGFVEIDQSNIGVYNTDEDPYWTLSAINLEPQPAIYGNSRWADYTTIPFPYNSLIEYKTNYITSEDDRYLLTELGDPLISG